MLSGRQLLDIKGRRSTRGGDHVVRRHLPGVDRAHGPTAAIGHVEGEVQCGQRELGAIHADDDRRGRLTRGLADDHHGAGCTARDLDADRSDEKAAEAAHAATAEHHQLSVGACLDQDRRRTPERDLDRDIEIGMGGAYLVGAGFAAGAQSLEQIIDRVGTEHRTTEAHALEWNRRGGDQREGEPSGDRLVGGPVDRDAGML